MTLTSTETSLPRQGLARRDFEKALAGSGASYPGAVVTEVKISDSAYIFTSIQDNYVLCDLFTEHVIIMVVDFYTS
jgi:hypothetical protein